MAETAHRERLIKTLALISGLAFLVFGWFWEVPEALDPRAAWVLGVTGLMAAFWLGEVLPIPVTALLPLLLFPMLGVMPTETTAKAYANDLTFLFFGGFFLAQTIEHCGLHRRIALRVIHFFGVRPKRLILGIMVAVALLSMWISNTATTLMMLPICMALVSELETTNEAERRKFGCALLLAVAYAANVGGMATPIGTAPNAIFLREFDGLSRPSFLQWMVVTVPLVAVFLTLIYGLLTRLLFRFGTDLSFSRDDVISQKIAEQGPLTKNQIATAWVFGVVVFLWVFRRDFDLGPISIPGWVSLLEALGLENLAGGAKSGVGDSAVAILGVLALCSIRVGPEKRPLADWEMTRNLPWGLLLLLGGGFAIAESFDVGGDGLLSLSAYIASGLSAVGSQSPYLLLPLVALVMTFVTEVTSNTTTTAVVMPILAGFSDPSLGFLLGFTATLSASCAFMLPVATPPNAIVFGAGQLRISDMVRAGLIINLIGVILISLTVLFIAAKVMPGI